MSNIWKGIETYSTYVGNAWSKKNDVNDGQNGLKNCTHKKNWFANDVKKGKCTQK